MSDLPRQFLSDAAAYVEQHAYNQRLAAAPAGQARGAERKAAELHAADGLCRVLELRGRLLSYRDDLAERLEHAGHDSRGLLRFCHAVEAVEQTPATGPSAAVVLWPELRVELQRLTLVDKPAAKTKRRGRLKIEKREAPAETKLIAALTQHHKYAAGGSLNQEPIGNNELARLAEVDKSTASAFFRQQFHGHGKYKTLCRDASRLTAALKMLNGEYSPHVLLSD